MIGEKLTILEAAQELCVSRQRMHQLIDEHNLKTERVHARLLLIHPRELKKIKADRPVGRPKKNNSEK